MVDVVYSAQARIDLKRLPKNIAQRIISKIYFFSQQEKPLAFAKPLRDFALGQYRFRVGDYRVIFDVDQRGVMSILLILRIKHRKDVYDV
ncbi:MAG: addiction module antitoxin [uncultured bacterium]|nr:MAG: addiction module antitoxin [uncultured bacterium]